LVAVDRSFPSGSLELDGRLDQRFVRGFAPPAADADRTTTPGATVRLPGFGAQAPLKIGFFAVSGAAGGQTLELEWNGALAARRDLGAGGRIEVEGWSDAEGTVVLRFTGPPPQQGRSVRVGRIDVMASAPGRVPVRRVLGYVGLAALTLAWCAWARASGRGSLLTLLLVCLTGMLAILEARVAFLGRLEALLGALFAGLLVAGLARRMGLRTAFAAVVAGTFALRLLFVLEPAFPAIDETFHAHRIGAVQEGRLVKSAVAGPRLGTYVEIPYPPAFHVILAPFVPRRDTPSGERAVRLAMAFFEGTAPLLLFLLARRGGADELGAGFAAACGAVLPESLLVLGKGIAANIAGSWFTLCAVLALLSEASPFVVAATMALGLLAHPGAAASLGGLAAAWLAWRARTEPGVRWQPSFLALGAGALLAFLVYYREVLPLTLSSLAAIRQGTAEQGQGLLRIEWVHLGKILQNLVLKYGGGPLWLAVIGLRVAPPVLRSLLTAWFGVAVFLAGLAVFTPISLRFEYFAAPAVALAAGCGSAALWRAGRRRVVILVLAAALVLQVALGVLLLEGRFVLRNVIIPSNRWPMMDGLR
jgi:hypothetical protein